jgi:hypothetical protein
LRRVVIPIRPVYQVHIGCYLNRESGLPVGGNHPVLNFRAAGDRHQEGPLAAHHQHEGVGTKMGREDLRVGDHSRPRAVPVIPLRCCLSLDRGR